MSFCQSIAAAIAAGVQAAIGPALAQIREETADALKRTKEAVEKQTSVVEGLSKDLAEAKQGELTPVDRAAMDVVKKAGAPLPAATMSEIVLG